MLPAVCDILISKIKPAAAMARAPYIRGGYLTVLQHHFAERGRECPWKIDTPQSKSETYSSSDQNRLTRILLSAIDYRTGTVDEVKQATIGNPESLIHAVVGDDKKYVCVIENISPEYVDRIGYEWGIKPDFFASYAENPERSKIWRNWTQLGQVLEQSLQGDGSGNAAASAHIHGIYEYYDSLSSHDAELSSSPNIVPRYCFRDPTTRLGMEDTLYADVESNTVISYIRVHESLCKHNFPRPSPHLTASDLILIDAPIDLILTDESSSFDKAATRLRFLLGTNPGGIDLPRLVWQPTYSLFDSFRSILQASQHWWHAVMFFPELTGVLESQKFHEIRQNAVIPPHALLYTLSSHICRSSLKYLQKDIRHISFHEIQRADVSTNTILLTRRQQLNRLSIVIDETQRGMRDDVKEFFNNHPRFKNADLGMRLLNPSLAYEHMAKDTNAIEDFLMQTFSLFNSSVNVKDSSLMIEQAMRTTRLTQLAFIYIPLSFVTGIFGMNISEINGSSLSWWVCFVAAGIILGVTMIIFWLLTFREKHINSRPSMV